MRLKLSSRYADLDATRRGTRPLPEDLSQSPQIRQRFWSRLKVRRVCKTPWPDVTTALY